MRPAATCLLAAITLLVAAQSARAAWATVTIDTAVRAGSLVPSRRLR